MAKSVIRLTVFVSGTSDADAEKSALSAIAAGLSEILEKTHAITIRVITSPLSIRPTVGCDLHIELTRELSEVAYDIYIGVLGARFGTASPRASLGSEEEFQIALARYRENPRTVRVLFYFKHQLTDPFAVDPQELQRVNDFRATLVTQGVADRSFHSTADFLDHVRHDLHHLIVNEWEGDLWKD